MRVLCLSSVLTSWASDLWTFIWLQFHFGYTVLEMHDDILTSFVCYIHRKSHTNIQFTNKHTIYIRTYNTSHHHQHAYKQRWIKKTQGNEGTKRFMVKYKNKLKHAHKQIKAHTITNTKYKTTSRVQCIYIYWIQL